MTTSRNPRFLQENSSIHRPQAFLSNIDSFCNNEGDIFNEVYAGSIRSIIDGEPPLSTIHNSYQQVMCVENCFKSSGGVTAIPAEFVEEVELESRGVGVSPGPDTVQAIKGIRPAMTRMFDEGLSFSEAGCPWARESKWVDIEPPSLLTNDRTPGT